MTPSKGAYFGLAVECATARLSTQTGLISCKPVLTGYRQLKDKCLAVFLVFYMHVCLSLRLSAQLSVTCRYCCQ